MIKQVIVMRTTYPSEKGPKKLRRGKEIAQACHASVAFLSKKMERISDNLFQVWLSPTEQEWIEGIFMKICLKVETEEELLEVERRAKEKGLNCHLITDRGLTEFGGIPTNTCLSIGPEEAARIDEVTGHLELY